MLWLTPEFYSLDQVVEITQAAPEHSSVEEEAIAFRGAVPRHGIHSKVPSRQRLYPAL